MLPSKRARRSFVNRNVILTAVIALLIGSGIGYWIFSGKSAGSANKQAATNERKVLFYRNSMTPARTSPVPAKDEMGMDYIPVYQEGSAAADTPIGTVKINPTFVQNIGVRTTIVKRATLSRNIRTIGRVTYDEQRVTRLHPKYDGWIDKLFVHNTGDQVNIGSMLASIYSPQLVATQEEYILALNSAETLKDSPFPDVRNGAESLLRSAHERLKLFDVPDHQIKKLKADRKVMKDIHIHSPFDGIVMNIGAREGERITPATELFMITDLSRIWVIVDIYEDDMPWVREGNTAKMKVAGIPGRIFTGKVTYIYPYLEAKTRTIKVRLEFDNPGLLLKPDMFANVDIQADKQVDTLVVPAEAIIRTGTQEQVFIQRAPGQFEPRQVTVGVSANGITQIVSGLDEGETVVTSSQFLIDSESKLKEATAKMLDVAKPAPGAALKIKPAPTMQPDMAPMEKSQPGSATKNNNINIKSQHMEGMNMEAQQ
jgi:Cu(I)/Ag(I) efflux system membrane fusion protein